MRIVECVPNFSEGRDNGKIKAIAEAISAVRGVELLDTDPGYDTNRTVITFIGDPEAVAEAAFQGIRKAAEVIDMRTHSGAHARMGATDVCPFIPVSGVSEEECVALAQKLGARVAEELNIPVYLYEKAAASGSRRNLADIRKGEYEGLTEKFTDPDWKPDFGPAQLNARSGATVIGVREFLIAYNVNLNTRDRKIASDIALTIREQGRLKRDGNGNVMVDSEGNKMRQPGLLPFCKAVGWYIDQYSCAQVSINLTDYKVTGLHHVFDAIVKEAEARGVRVTGSELVGLVPKTALLDSAAHYLKRQGRSAGQPEKERIRLAVQTLGLAELAPFVPEEKIIDYRVQGQSDDLIRMTLSGFADELSTESPAPGGGSVSALAGALSASLASMVAHLSLGKNSAPEKREEFLELPLSAQQLKDELLKAVDEDTQAFNGVMNAMKMPRKTKAESDARDRKMEEAVTCASEVPLHVMELSLDAMKLCAVTAEYGNQNSLSDSGVGILQAMAAMEGAAMNVLINIRDLKNENTRLKYAERTEKLLEEGRSLSGTALINIRKILS